MMIGFLQNNSTLLGVTPADLEETANLVRKTGTSFYYAMRMLPTNQRATLYAIYAFCRLVDDVVDGPYQTTEKFYQLNKWRQHINNLYNGLADNTITRTLLVAAQHYNLQKSDFLAIIDGMQMDVEKLIVAPDAETLDLYCDRCAGAVGRLITSVVADPSPKIDQVIWSLSRAVQFTNILRDIAEDADRGRLYLPAEILNATGVPHDAAAALVSKNLPSACYALAAQARAHYKDVNIAISQSDPFDMQFAKVISSTYESILKRLEHTRWQNPRDRVCLPRWQKIWFATRYGAKLIL